MNSNKFLKTAAMLLVALCLTVAMSTSASAQVGYHAHVEIWEQGSNNPIQDAKVYIRFEHATLGWSAWGDNVGPVDANYYGRTSNWPATTIDKWEVLLIVQSEGWYTGYTGVHPASNQVVTFTTTSNHFSWFVVVTP